MKVKLASEHPAPSLFGDGGGQRKSGRPGWGKRGQQQRRRKRRKVKIGLVSPGTEPPGGRGEESSQPPAAPTGSGFGGRREVGVLITFWSTMEQAISRTWARLKSPAESCSSSTGSRLSPIWRWKATPPPAAAPGGGSGLGGRISGVVLIENFPPEPPPEQRGQGRKGGAGCRGEKFAAAPEAPGEFPREVWGKSRRAPLGWKWRGGRGGGGRGPGRMQTGKGGERDAQGDGGTQPSAAEVVPPLRLLALCAARGRDGPRPPPGRARRPAGTGRVGVGPRRSATKRRPRPNRR